MEERELYKNFPGPGLGAIRSNKLREHEYMYLIVYKVIHELTITTLIGGLLNELKSGQREGGIMMAPPGTFGLPPRERPGSILRRQVRELLPVHQLIMLQRCSALLMVESSKIWYSSREQRLNSEA